MENDQPDQPDPVENKAVEENNETEDGVAPVVKQKRKMTPEYKKILIERLEKARATKAKAKKVGVKIKRNIKADPDEKANFCTICRRSYASPYGLKVHCRKVHGEKKISEKVKDAETKKETSEPKEEPLEKKTETSETKKDNEDPPKNEVVKNTPDVKEITDKERLLIAQQKQAQAQRIAQAQAQAQVPPAPPKMVRQPPSEPRYTVREYRVMEQKHRENIKSREKEMKAKAKADHIQKSIALMMSGGL
tara:strand:+ start:84 stop:830 length:747 start_codon:yes stop_codon:yes gene_type:complete